MAAAIKEGLEGGFKVVANGHPPLSIIPVGIARVGSAVAVGIEVQIRDEFVSGASGVGTPHACGCVGEGGVVARGVGRGRAVAIKVPADGIQLHQIGHFNESIAVRVVARVPRVSCIVWSVAVIVAVQLFRCLPPRLQRMRRCHLYFGPLLQCNSPLRSQLATVNRCSEH